MKNYFNEFYEEHQHKKRLLDAELALMWIGTGQRQRVDGHRFSYWLAVQMWEQEKLGKHVIENLYISFSWTDSWSPEDMITLENRCEPPKMNMIEPKVSTLIGCML